MYPRVKGETWIRNLMPSQVHDLIQAKAPTDKREMGKEVQRGSLVEVRNRIHPAFPSHTEFTVHDGKAHIQDLNPLLDSGGMAQRALYCLTGVSFMCHESLVCLKTLTKL